MNTALTITALAAFGLIFGSFINALVWRMHNKRNWVSERSECPHCHHILEPKDLVPVLSYLVLKGKCRYCKKPIPDTPLAELLLPAVWIVSYLLWPVQLQGAGLFQFIAWLVLWIGFIALFIYDLRWFLLPNKIVFPIIGLSALQVLVLPIAYNYSWHTLLGAALGGLALSGIFYLIFQMSDGKWIGGGDVKLAIALGILAGDPLRAALLLFFASLIGTLAAMPQLIKNGLKTKTVVPFGPLLIAGLLLTQLFGSAIISWYAGMIDY